MTHIAQQRIKKDGEYYASGDPITLTEDEFADLPEGAAVPDEGAVVDEPHKAAVELTDAQTDALKTAVARLKPGAFKQDGEIRAGALKGLNDQLDFDVTVESVAAAKA